MLFVALAVLCDEWLVPHLEVVQKTMRMSDDLAGVTLMAFGGAVRRFKPIVLIAHFHIFVAPHLVQSLNSIHLVLLRALWRSLFPGI